MSRCVLTQLCCIALFGILCESSNAWNSPGHETVAAIAWGRLTPEMRDKAVQLLKKHPRFDDHFTGNMPDSVRHGNEETKNAWIFAFAATWPDLVRSEGNGVTDRDVKDFNRGRWHFINKPVFLNATEKADLDGDLSINLREDVPASSSDAIDPRKGMNLVQALKFAAIVTKDRDTRAPNKAKYLCWLSHLVGDSHQPLHSSALFTSQRFEDGDQGGNLIIVRDKKLHGTWDDIVLEKSASFDDVQKKAKSLTDTQEFTSAAEAAIAEMRFAEWINEGAKIANEVVYSPTIL